MENGGLVLWTSIEVNAKGDNNGIHSSNLALVFYLETVWLAIHFC